jgi:putative tryptophan/tyrosine transport system substrate-binding protein
VNRRELIALVGAGLIVRPAAAGAQQKALPVIGFLGVNSPGAMASYAAAFHRGLSETGYVEGQNATIEYRWAEGHYDRLPALAADLVGRKVDVIATSGAGARAAKDATSTISIVSLVGDPVATGLYAQSRAAGRQPYGRQPPYQ